MATLVSSGRTRDTLSLVNELLQGIGENECSSFDGGRPVVTKAVHAVNDALQEIWSRTRWPFRLRWVQIDLTASGNWYSLPENFGEVAMDLIFRGGEVAPIPEITFEELFKRYPTMTTMPVPPLDLSWAINFFADTDAMGSPEWFAIVTAEDTDKLVLHPTPDADFIADASSAALAYFCTAPDMVITSEEVTMPRGMWPAHKFLALAFLKQAMEHPDAQVDEQRAERYLAREMARRMRRSSLHMAFKPGCGAV